MHTRPQTINRVTEKLAVNTKNIPVTKDFHVTNEKLKPIAREPRTVTKYFD